MNREVARDHCTLFFFIVSDHLKHIYTSMHIFFAPCSVFLYHTHTSAKSAVRGWEDTSTCGLQRPAIEPPAFSQDDVLSTRVFFYCAQRQYSRKPLGSCDGKTCPLCQGHKEDIFFQLLLKENLCGALQSWAALIILKNLLLIGICLKNELVARWFSIPGVFIKKKKKSHCVLQ